MTTDGAVTHGRPLCPCHGEPMTRRNDRASGWRCSVKHRRAQQTPAERYARTKRNLRARIERKRRRIAELEGAP